MSEALLSDILTAQEVADMLKLPLSRVVALARRRELPAKKAGREWRFRASEIAKWFSDWQPNTFDPNKKAGEILEALNGKKKDRLYGTRRACKDTTIKVLVYQEGCSW